MDFKGDFYFERIKITGFHFERIRSNFLVRLGDPRGGE
jgi:hypothetical protein